MLTNNDSIECKEFNADKIQKVVLNNCAGEVKIVVSQGEKATVKAVKRQPDKSEIKD
ncbi:MAG: hypothetical protein NZ480_01205 [Bdellovibrionaceae bacterium]|nr:hypothetical protein [Pseudobdellovibrionaceae bacterium]MDW8189781.1 hypothetical protein [Pseudobdellovibrionaceae bacterium]